MKTLKTTLVALCLIIAGLTVKADESKNAPVLKTDFAGFIGETLVYSIKWDPPWYMFFVPKMEAGELVFRFQGIDEFQGKPAVKIVLEARSSGTLAKLADMKVEDEFLYYSSPETLCAEGSISKISEGKRRRREELVYFQEERRLIFNLFDEASIPPRLLRSITKTDLPPCVQDPLAALYSYRALPLAKGHEKILTVGNNDKALEVRTRIETQDTVNTPAGKFKAWKIGTNALSGGLFRENGDFRIWISADDKKLPVRFEAKVRLGSIVGALKSVEMVRGAS